MLDLLNAFTDALAASVCTRIVCICCACPIEQLGTECIIDGSPPPLDISLRNELCCSHSDYSPLYGAMTAVQLNAPTKFLRGADASTNSPHVNTQFFIYSSTTVLLHYSIGPLSLLLPLHCWKESRGVSQPQIHYCIERLSGNSTFTALIWSAVENTL